VVGFNDTQSTLFYPPLTRVREFPEKLGRHLAEFVIKRARNPSQPAPTLTISTQFVIRESMCAGRVRGRFPNPHGCEFLQCFPVPQRSETGFENYFPLAGEVH